MLYIINLYIDRSFRRVKRASEGYASVRARLDRLVSFPSMKRLSKTTEKEEEKKEEEESEEENDATTNRE